jgi:fibronectin type 3 domain-containing protein
VSGIRRTWWWLAAGVALALLVLGLWRTMGMSAFWQMHHTVTLRWNATTTPGVLRYNAYRGLKREGPYGKINQDEILGLSYVDEHAESGKHYYYVVRAVNINHKESIDSEIVEADVPWP